MQFKTCQDEGNRICWNGSLCFQVSLEVKTIFYSGLTFENCFSDDPRQCEPLDPPTGSQPGDRVLVEGYETGEPDAVLNPKKKVWEKLQEDLRVSGAGRAEWQGNPLHTQKGSVVALTLKSVPIK